MKVKVILKEDIKGVGKKDDIVEVKDGFANNYILNTKKGVLATPENLKKLQDKANKKEKEHNKALKEAEELKKVLESKTLELKIKAGKSGKVFGSIGSKEVADLIKEKLNVEIDKKKIVSNTSRLKDVGLHIVEIKLYSNVKANVKIEVIGVE